MVNLSEYISLCTETKKLLENHDLLSKNCWLSGRHNQYFGVGDSYKCLSQITKAKISSVSSQIRKPDNTVIFEKLYTKTLMFHVHTIHALGKPTIYTDYLRFKVTSYSCRRYNIKYLCQPQKKLTVLNNLIFH